MLANIYLERNNYRAAGHLYKTVLDRYSGWSEDTIAANCRLGLGLILSAQGNDVLALPSLEAARDSFRNIGYQPGLASALLGLTRIYGNLAIQQNALGHRTLSNRYRNTALAAGQEAISLFRICNDPAGILFTWIAFDNAGIIPPPKVREILHWALQADQSWHSMTMVHNGEYV